MARKFISNNTKLEHQNQYNKFLSLDPQRKKKKNLHHHYQNVEEEEEEEEEEEDEEKGKNQQPHFHIHSQEQVFHFQQPHELFSHHHNLLYQDLDIQQEAQPKKRSYFPPPAPPPPSSSSSCQKQKVGTSSRFGPRNCGGGGGEIVEVQGGHIIRSIGRKDRHSKVCTAKGPRDRRVRLAAHTAIQFYDVQDRLGYDRPSKAVDWLIKKAKASIDELAELPPWKPTIGPTTTNNNSFDQEKNVGIHCEEEDAQLVDDDNNDNVAGPSSKRAMIMLDNGSDTRVMHRNNSASSSGENANANGSFLPPSLDSDAISDTIKSFFPMGGGSNEGNSSAMQFHTFQEHNLLSRTNSQSQDLRLSLQSFQDPILLHHQNQQSQHHNHHTEQAQAQAHFQASNFFTGSTPLIGFDASGWSLEHHHQQPMELGRMQRLAAARAGGDNSTGIALDGGEVTGAGGYLFNSPPSPPLLQQLFVQNQFLSQRGPLQSSYSPSIRAWNDPSAIAIATADPIHHHHHQHHQAHMLPMYSASVSGIGFASEVGGFSGFRIPARIQGEIEEHDGISDKPSSASSDSLH